MAQVAWADLTDLAYGSFRALAAAIIPDGLGSEDALFQKALDELTTINALYLSSFPHRLPRRYVLDHALYRRLQHIARAHGLHLDQVATAVVLHYLDQNPRLDGSDPRPHTWAIHPNTDHT